ncbi:MAG TPA: FecR domain-containing protein [Sphingobium sp.]|uniref:FecR family protein n=1 Tax=Sphingobium sp. TaxID=1912891 RepID=UPI002ED6156E
MTSQGDPLPKRGQLRDEAAAWFAIMRGPEADARRAEFEAWLALGALHRTAYNKIAETFSIGKGLKHEAPQGSEGSQAATMEKRKPNRHILIAVLTTASLVGALSLIIAQTRESAQGSSVVHPQHVVSDDSSVQFSTHVGEIKTFMLTDGSSVTLDTDSLLAVSFTRQERGLRLMRGRARFVVEQATRPFIVRAGDGTITAHGTIFDVVITRGDEVRVRLLRGAVDVEVASKSQNGGLQKHSRRLAPGEQINFGIRGRPEQPARGELTDADTDWPEDIRDFDHIRLGDLISEANRYATTPIVLSSNDLRELRVSGTFRLRDTLKLADNLATMLRINIVKAADNITLSRSCAGDQKKNCRPVS